MELSFLCPFLARIWIWTALWFVSSSPYVPSVYLESPQSGKLVITSPGEGGHILQGIRKGEGQGNILPKWLEKTHKSMPCSPKNLTWKQHDLVLRVKACSRSKVHVAATGQKSGLIMMSVKLWHGSAPVEPDQELQLRASCPMGTNSNLCVHWGRLETLLILGELSNSAIPSNKKQ